VRLKRHCDRAEWVSNVQFVRDCRDPKDDRFLELALNCRADVIVSGDLLAPTPLAGIHIVSAAHFLENPDRWKPTKHNG